MYVNTVSRRANAALGEILGFIARALDVVLIAASAILAAKLRFGTLTTEGAYDALLVAFSMACAAAVLPKFSLYRSWRGRSMIALASRVLLAWLAVQACGLIVIFLVRYSSDVSRLWFAYWTAIGAVPLIGMRIVAYAVLKHARRTGFDLRSVALVGYGAHCESVRNSIDTVPGSGFRAAVIFDPRIDASDVRSGASTTNEFNAFVAHVRKAGIQELWLALPILEGATILRIIDAFREELINIRFLPDVHSLALFDGGLIELMGTPAINLAASPLPPGALIQKAMFDRAFAAIVLLALTPVFAAIAVAVKLSSPGPVFFRQYRKGADGRVFRIFKFRSMRVHQEARGVVRQATRSDPRITRVGSFLRRTSLDELPQFINVLRGEMSVVGPRPHAIEHDEFYGKLVDSYIHRYRIKPGITGWAQVNGFRGETDQIEKMASRVEYDLHYMRNWTFWMDIRIVMMTVYKSFISPQAY
ncbi:undecaprenyl-phosphate glucose phosphotransferase [Caballeronia zhejiangensis]|uniref:undecaprenyl-phosphate glucose phosphotransferase n=1 Tax=Caballeronia zhejiangensis TaxID=871203 RepID=UPI001F518B8C|nr:undecaprenyl-phosphate glucose phosphotransferase [Caballeronia zhejiangensis]MCI1046998.1 undecaprenyl-phosphate glucose phosphotransferase [Caballeronia zhejiangensis]